MERGELFNDLPLHINQSRVLLVHLRRYSPCDEYSRYCTVYSIFSFGVKHRNLTVVLTGALNITYALDQVLLVVNFSTVVLKQTISNGLESFKKLMSGHKRLYPLERIMSSSFS